MLSTLIGPAGRLEGVESRICRPPLPRGRRGRSRAAPDYGGTMRTRVVYEVGKGLARAGCAACGSNYRGVGSSAGTWTPEEPACARRRLQGWPGRHARLAIRAWRSGASGTPSVPGWLPWPATAMPGVTAVVAPFGTTGRLLRLLAARAIRRPSSSSSRPNSTSSPGEVRCSVFYATLLEPRELVVIDGADHAFRRHALDVGDAIEELLATSGQGCLEPRNRRRIRVVRLLAVVSRVLGCWGSRVAGF